MEQGLYPQGVMINRRESDDVEEKDNTKKSTSKENHQEQNIGLSLIISGRNKMLWHVNQISIKTIW